MPKPSLAARFAIALVVIAACPGLANAQWSGLTESFPGTGQPETCLLLTDGTVMCQEYLGQWHRLYPDPFGSYQNGKWDVPTGVATMPDGTDGTGVGGASYTGPYTPLYYASQVLVDGTVVVIGGEYNSDSVGNVEVWTDMGFQYNPATNTWSAQLTEPFGCNIPSNPANQGTCNIGDAQSLILQNNVMYLADINNKNMATFDESTLTFNLLVTSGKNDRNDEEGWTPLPIGPLGQILTVDAGVANTSEIFDPTTNTWGNSANTQVSLSDAGGACNSQEVGAAVSRPDGTVVNFTGSGSLSTAGNAVYTIATNSWVQTASFPHANECSCDGPASLLPSGNVLVLGSPTPCNSGTGKVSWNTPSYFYEFDGTNLNPVTAPPGAGSIVSYQSRMLLLPTGQVLFTAYDETGSGTVVLQIYTPSGSPQNAWLPVITQAPTSVNPATTYTISGNQFNGFSQGATYGDDAQMNTNFPLVRITNPVTGHVFYAKTHDINRMGVEAVGSTEVETTSFDTPNDPEIGGQCNLQVVTNGLASKVWVINGPTLTIPGPISMNTCEGTTTTANLNVCNTGKEDLSIASINSSNSQITVSTPSSGYAVTISPDACFPFQVNYSPTGTGTTKATLTIDSNDPNVPSATVAVTATTPAPSINATVSNAGNFGNVCPGGASSLNLNVTNQSSCNLVINSVTTSAGFLPPTTVSYPLTLTADATVPLPIAFDPSSSQACSTSPITGTVTVNSNDPTQPGGNTTIALSGTVPCPHISTTIPNSGNFGTSCSGQVSDLNLEVLNTGQCNLNIASISSSSTQFALPTSPLVLSADANVDLPVAFQPAKYGSPGYVTCSNTVPETSNITITSNDPTNPIYVVPVQGIEGCPTMVLGPLNLTGVNDYPPTVSDPTGTLGCYTDKQITVSNTGICPLYVVNAATVNGLDGKGLPLPAAPLEYNVVNTTLPITVKPGGKPAPVTVRFKPEILTDQNPFAPDQQTGTLNLTSNDPLVGDNTAALCGEPTYGSGARILLVDTLDNPISEVTELILTTTNITPVFNETLKPAPLQPPANVCGNTINYHLDNETLKPTGSNPNAYYRVLVKDNPHYYPPVDFRLTQCQFQQIVIVRKY